MTLQDLEQIVAADKTETVEFKKRAGQRTLVNSGINELSATLDSLYPLPTC
jgi:hypothetical protein